jgi:hypothetical protein
MPFLPHRLKSCRTPEAQTLSATTNRRRYACELARGGPLLELPCRPKLPSPSPPGGPNGIMPSLVKPQAPVPN